jgi:hypothetical protein
MVAGLLGPLTHAVHEGQRGNEILKLERSRQLPGLDLPAGQGAETGSSFFLGE